MADARKDFGKRGITPAPIVTHAPQGLPGAPEPHSARRLRSVAITIGAVGAAAIGMLALTQGLQHVDRNVDCPRPPEGSDSQNSQCYYSHSSSGYHGSYRGGSFGQSGASFGGFGASGSAHGGGGGGE